MNMPIRVVDQPPTGSILSNEVDVTVGFDNYDLTLGVTPTSGLAPLTVTCSGTLTGTSTPSLRNTPSLSDLEQPAPTPISNATIWIWSNGASVGSVQTDDNGNYTVQVEIAFDGEYTLQASYLPGD